MQDIAAAVKRKDSRFERKQLVELVSNQPRKMLDLPDMRNDKHFILDVVANSYYVLSYVPEHFLADRDFMLREGDLGPEI